MAEAERWPAQPVTSPCLGLMPGPGKPGVWRRAFLNAEGWAQELIGLAKIGGLGSSWESRRMDTKGGIPGLEGSTKNAWVLRKQKKEGHLWEGSELGSWVPRAKASGHHVSSQR